MYELLLTIVVFSHDSFKEVAANTKVGLKTSMAETVLLKSKRFVTVKTQFFLEMETFQKKVMQSGSTQIRQFLIDDEDDI